MQQSLTKVTPYEEYTTHRTQRPVLMKRAQLLFVTALVLLDISCTGLAFYLAYRILRHERPPEQIGPFWDFWQPTALYVVVLVTIFFFQRMYQRRRPISHLDELFKIFSLNVFAT